jgi:hypothetical protein
MTRRMASPSFPKFGSEHCKEQADTTNKAINKEIILNLMVQLRLQNDKPLLNTPPQEQENDEW